ncbi:hypothetical protein D3C78_908920 [compost metagenome]
MRAAEAQRHAEALGAAQGDVGTELAGRGQQGQGQQVGGHRHQGVGGVEALHQCAVVEDVAVGGRVLQQGAEVGTGVGDLALVADHYLDPQGLGTGDQYVEGLRVAMLGGEEGIAALVLRQALAEGHGFGGGGAFVEHRGVGHRQAAEIADQGLEVQQGFEAALGDFRLVGGVGGVPGRVFQQVAQDRAGRVAGVVALADMALEQLVLAGDGLDRGEGFSLALADRQVEHAGALDAVGDDAGGQGFDVIEAEQGEHGPGVGLARADMAGDEFVAGAEDGGFDAHGLSSAVGFQQVFVAGLVEEAVEDTGVGQLHAEEPALAQGLFVDQFGAVHQLLVDFHHLAVQRHHDVAGGLHRLQYGDFRALGVALEFRKLHEDHIAQRVLRVLGNADGDATVCFKAQPFVVGGETQYAHLCSSTRMTRLFLLPGA